MKHLKLIKSTISLALSIALLFAVSINSINILVNAESTECILTDEFLRSCSLDELYALSHTVENSKNVNAVFLNY